MKMPKVPKVTEKDVQKAANSTLKLLKTTGEILVQVGIIVAAVNSLRGQK